MMTERLAVVPLRIFLVVLFGVLVMLQTFSLPGQFAYMARESPDLAYLRWPLTAMAVFWVLCVQVVVVCTWRLLTLVTDDRIFSPASLAWVDAIVGRGRGRLAAARGGVPVRRVPGGRSRASRCCSSCSWSAAPSSGCCWW